MLDDIIYVCCLLSSVGIAGYFRKLKDENQRKLYGTAFGLLITTIVSGLHALHSLIPFAICAIIIVKVHPSRSHLMSFGVMFGYLLFFRTTTLFGLPPVPGHTNMIQMILTMKMTGIAFEKNSAYNKVQQRKKLEQEGNASAKDVEITDYDKELLDLSILEMFHYSFNYIGLLTGPYYRYRTFRDYFETPFKDYAKCTEDTIERLKYVVLYAVVHLIFGYYWPISYATSTDFYENRTWLYRLFYLWPAFIIFRTRIFAGLALGECVCTNAGFGAYPDEANATSGEGPKLDQYSHLKRDADKSTYNFQTIQNINVFNVETCALFRACLKEWNVCIQYWLAVNVYKRFPNKRYRMAATILCSSFWHGIYPGHYLCLMGAPFYIPVEDIYDRLYRKNATGFKRKIIDTIFCISKMFALGYLGMAFYILKLNQIWYYYSSVYHFGYLYYLVLLVVAMVLVKLKKGDKKKTLPAADQKPKIN